MINTETFVQNLITDARSLMHWTNGDASRAVRVALQDAHTELSQEDFFAAIAALGGHNAVVATVTAAVTRPLTLPELYNLMGWPPEEIPSRADIEAQIEFEREHGM